MFKEVMEKEVMNKEILSRLLDDDLNEQEMNKALDALLEDPAAQQSWHAMHVVRGAINDDADDKGAHASFSLLDKITASIENEATILAPDNLPLPTPTEGATRKSVRMPAYIALAASVIALVTLINYSPLKNMPQSELAMSPQAQMQIARELQSMVVQHGEFSGAAALNGLVAYVKVVNGTTAAGVMP